MVELFTILSVSNAFRLLGSGELKVVTINGREKNLSQMPFGFWVLGNWSAAARAKALRLCLKCLSAFGFWGTGRRTDYRTSKPRLKCLSAFGFWGTYERPTYRVRKMRVSNAFRLLGSGELLVRLAGPCLEQGVSNAFRLLGSGEPGSNGCTQHRKNKSLKCLSAFGFWGTPSL